MQADLLPFIDWKDQPRRVIAPSDKIIVAGEPTDTLFLLESGVAVAYGAALNNAPADDGTKDVQYQAGALLSLLEMLALESYLHDVCAMEECRVIGINRHAVKTMWQRQNRLAWPLSCSIAATITQPEERRIRL